MVTVSGMTYGNVNVTIDFFFERLNLQNKLHSEHETCRKETKHHVPSAGKPPQMDRNTLHNTP